MHYTTKQWNNTLDLNYGHVKKKKKKQKKAKYEIKQIWNSNSIFRILYKSHTEKWFIAVVICLLAHLQDNHSNYI